LAFPRSKEDRASSLVLVATPVAGDRAFLSELLQAEGYAVCCAVDGQDALRQVVLRWPSLIVLSMDLPRLTGQDFLEARSEHVRLSTIPVLAISDGAPHPAVEGVLARPFAPECVLAEVSRLTGSLERTA
jgi:CheY-like chemotaxis protein